MWRRGRWTRRCWGVYDDEEIKGDGDEIVGMAVKRGNVNPVMFVG